MERPTFDPQILVLDGELQVFFDKFAAKGIAVEFDLTIGLSPVMCQVPTSGRDRTGQ